MLVPGAMAATSATTVMRNPAEAARAPEGPTNTATGTRELSIASMIWRIDVSRPPGVSSLSTTRGASRRPRGRARTTTCAALIACTTPVSSTTGMSARAGTATKEAARVSAPRRLWIPTDTRKCNGPNSFLSMDPFPPASPRRAGRRRIGIMFGTLGGPEVILILVVALIVFGPRRLPEIGKSMGKMLAEFRKASNDFKRTIEDELEAEKSRESQPTPTPAPESRGGGRRSDGRCRARGGGRAGGRGPSGSPSSTGRRRAEPRSRSRRSSGRRRPSSAAAVRTRARRRTGWPRSARTG